MNSKNGTTFQSVIHGEEELEILIVFTTNKSKTQKEYVEIRKCSRLLVVNVHV